jgi:hypothetical protein
MEMFLLFAGEISKTRLLVCSGVLFSGPREKSFMSLREAVFRDPAVSGHLMIRLRAGLRAQLLLTAS